MLEFDANDIHKNESGEFSANVIHVTGAEDSDAKESIPTAVFDNIIENMDMILTEYEVDLVTVNVSTKNDRLITITIQETGDED